MILFFKYIFLGHPLCAYCFVCFFIYKCSRHPRDGSPPHSTVSSHVRKVSLDSQEISLFNYQIYWTTNNGKKTQFLIGFKESWTLVLARISLFVFSRRIFLRRALDEGQVGSKPFNSFLFSKSLSIRVYLESLSLFKSVTDNRFNVKFSSGHRKLAISKAPHR